MWYQCYQGKMKEYLKLVLSWKIQGIFVAETRMFNIA